MEGSGKRTDQDEYAYSKISSSEVDDSCFTYPFWKVDLMISRGN